MARATLAILILCVLTGCDMERRVVAVRGSMATLPGAVGGVRPAPVQVEAGGEDRTAEALTNPMGFRFEGEPDEQLRITRPDGSVFLVCRNPRELLFHLRNALIQEDKDAIVEQLLAKQTLQSYRDLGRDPAEAAEFLLERRREVMRMMLQMPMGELTPGQFMQPIGRNAFRLRVRPDAVDPPLKFTNFDYVYEDDGCRLLLIS